MQSWRIIFKSLGSRFCSYRQSWRIRGMSSASAAEAIEAPKVLGLQGKEEHVEKIVVSFDEVSFCISFLLGRSVKNIVV